MGNAVGVGAARKQPPDSSGGEGTVIQDVYNITEDVLGRGEVSVVKKAVHRVTGKEVAVKIINKSQCQGQDKLNVQREIAIMRHLQSKPHSSVIGLHQVFETTRHVYLVMDYAEGGELFDRLTSIVSSEESSGRSANFRSSRMSEMQAARLCLQLIEGVKHLHSQGVVHRNLKPETIFCTSRDPKTFGLKISQFGLAAFQAGEEAEPLQRFCGSRSYIAPEIYRAEGYGKQCDIWSAGVILYILLSGTPPFDADANPEILQTDICEMRYSLDDSNWAKVSAEGKELVQLMLQADVSKRITCDEILQHPWLSKAVRESAPKPSPLKREWTARKVLASLLGGTKGVEAAKAAEVAGAKGGNLPYRLRQQALAAQKAHLLEDEEFSRSRSAETWRDVEVKANRKELEAGAAQENQGSKMVALSRGSTFPLRRPQQRSAPSEGLKADVEEAKAQGGTDQGAKDQGAEQAPRSPKGVEGSERRNRPDRLRELQTGSFRVPAAREQLDWAGRRSPLGKALSPVLGRNSPQAQAAGARHSSPSYRTPKTPGSGDSPSPGSQHGGRNSPALLKRAGSSRRKLPPPPIKIQQPDESDSTEPERPIVSPKGKMRSDLKSERQSSSKSLTSEIKEPRSTRGESPMSRRSRDLRREHIRRNSPASSRTRDKQTPKHSDLPDRVRAINKFESDPNLEILNPLNPDGVEQFDELEAFRLASAATDPAAHRGIERVLTQGTAGAIAGGMDSSPRDSVLSSQALFSALNVDEGLLPGMPMAHETDDPWDIPAPMSRDGSTVGSSGRRTRGSYASTPTESLPSFAGSLVPTPSSTRRTSPPHYTPPNALGIPLLSSSSEQVRPAESTSSPKTEAQSVSEAGGLGDISNGSSGTGSSGATDSVQPAENGNRPQTDIAELSPLTPPVTPTGGVAAKSPVATPTSAMDIRQNLLEISGTGNSSGTETEVDETEGLFAALVNLNVVHMPPASSITRPNASPDYASTPLEI